jgi:hypothetical protein
VSDRPPGVRLRGGVLLAALGAAACAAAPVVTTQHPFLTEVEEQRWEAAARTFEADSTLWASPQTLLLAGQFYADPTLSTFDQPRARQVLSRLTMGFPESLEAIAARPLLGLLAELESLGGELHARTAALEGRMALADSLAASRDSVEQELQTMRRRIERLEAELEEARQELERLKAVDLRPRPGSPR